MKTITYYCLEEETLSKERITVAGFVCPTVARLVHFELVKRYSGRRFGLCVDHLTLFESAFEYDPTFDTEIQERALATLTDDECKSLGWPRKKL